MRLAKVVGLSLIIGCATYALYLNVLPGRVTRSGRSAHPAVHYAWNPSQILNVILFGTVLAIAGTYLYRALRNPQPHGATWKIEE